MSKLRQMERRYGFHRGKDGILYVPKGASVFVIEPELRGRLIRHRGGLNADNDLGVLARKVITTIGVNFLAAAFINTNEPETINYHSSGTNNTAEATSDTALGTEVETRQTGTQSNPSSNVYRSVATVTYTATRAIVEHGLHWHVSNASTLWDRSIFSTINVVSGDSIQFTYNLTLTAGG
jgi:hypothetical protein